jgi:hypothetical protein
MAEVKKAAAAEPTAKLWPVVGKAWINPSKKNPGTSLVNIVMGNQRDAFETITLKPGDKLVLRPNSKRPGKQDADYQVCLPS